MTNRSNTSGILLKIPVPWMFILTYMLGLIPQFLVPLGSDGQHVNIQAAKIAGAFLFLFGGLFAAWSLIIFNETKLTTKPGKISKKLVMSGPYKVSRNPLYVSLAMVYLGGAGILGQLWPVLFLPLLLICLNKVIIPLEEKMLTADFGDEYKSYCSKVKRWV